MTARPDYDLDLKLVNLWIVRSPDDVVDQLCELYEEMGGLVSFSRWGTDVSLERIGSIP